MLRSRQAVPLKGNLQETAPVPSRFTGSIDTIILFSVPRCVPGTGLSYLHVFLHFAFKSNGDFMTPALSIFRSFIYLFFRPSVGLELMTPRSRVTCSSDRAGRGSPLLLYR